MIYKSQRAKAWRNMIVAGINYGLETGYLLTRQNETHDFSICGIPAVVSYCGFFDNKEVSIKVAAFWKGSELRLKIPLCLHREAAFNLCDAYAYGWLEREYGPYIAADQRSGTCLYSRRYLVPVFADMVIDNNGYTDHRLFRSSQIYGG